MNERRHARGLRHFFRDYTAGFDVRDVRQTLRRDATRAYEVLTREHAHDVEPSGRFRRFMHRLKILFLGLSYKLSPPRRILFAVCIVVALYAWINRNGIVFQTTSMNVQLVGSASLLLASVAGLVFLLALELTDRVLVRDELEVARQLQRDLLPAEPPDVEGLELAFSYRTANTIGGDYYDFLTLEDGRLAIVVGDASGHGIAAGLLMAIANASLQLAIDLDASPAAVVRLMNRALYRTGGPRAFMTMFYGVLDPGSGHLEYVTVGHPYPYLRRADGTVVELGEGSLPLGLRRELDPRPASVSLEWGDLLVLYSDGVPESVNAARDSFGFDRLRGLVAAGGSVTEVHDRVLRAVRAFAQGEAPHDDSSLVVIGRVAGANQPGATAAGPA